MDYELLIGQYNNLGKFDCEQWKILFNFFNRYVDCINIYSLDENEMKSNNCKYKLLPPIDNSNSLYGFKIVHIDELILEYLRDYSYSIDDGIQFLYFFNEERLLAEIKVEDCDNSVKLYLNLEEKNDLCSNYMKKFDTINKIP